MKQVCEHIPADAPHAACAVCKDPTSPRFMQKYPLGECISRYNGAKVVPARYVVPTRNIRRVKE